jgi:eukaryotic-like serine/threonine-protein kinase
MSERPLSLELDSLPIEQMRRVNALADRFEAELRAGTELSASSFVFELDDPHARLVLLRLMMLTEQELERQRSAGNGQGGSRAGDTGGAAHGAAGDATLDVVRRIPGYDIEAELGRGGMGIVYLGRQRGLNRRVALKVLYPGPKDGPELRARFRREAELVAKCRHPNLVQIYHTGEHEGVPYLALEYAEGGSLEKQLDGTPWSPKRAAELMEPLARAVADAHDQGIIHRDLKPENILLDAAGTPKVSDFGLAMFTEQDSRLTTSGDVLGTPSYMSPEQAGGHSKRLGPATDVYALGAILYELLTGRAPFKAGSPLETLRQVCEVEVVRPSDLQPKVPRDLETICLTCLSKEPGRRYASAADLAADLRRYLKNEPITARRPPPSERFGRWCRRNPWIAAFMALLAVGLGLTSWLLWKTSRAEASAVLAARRAVAEGDVARAVNDFFLTDVLAQAGVHAQAKPGAQTDPDLKVRTALDRAAGRIQGKFADKPLVEAAIRRTIGDSYHSLALYVQARSHLERARGLFLQERGPGHPDTLATLGSLAQVALDQDRLADAERLMQERIGAARAAHGDRSIETFKAEHDLAFLYVREEKYAEAEPILTRVADGQRGLLGEGGPDLLATMNTQAQLYHRQRRFDDAERMFLKVVEGRRATRGAEHPETLSAASDLALVYAEQKNYDLAERTLTDVLKILDRAFGKTHPATLDAMDSLATVLVARGRHPEAEAQLTAVLDGRRRRLGEEHSATLLAMNNLGVAYLFQQKYAAAEPLFIRLLEVRRRLLDWKQPHTVTAAIMALDDVSALHVMQRKLKEAEPLLKESLEMRRRWLGPAHAETVQSTQHLAQTLLLEQRPAEAEPLFEEVRRRRAEAPNVDDAEMARTLDNLGEVRIQQQKFAEAEQSMRACLSVRRKIAPESWELFLSRAKLGASLLGLKKYADAEPELLAGYEGMKAREASIPFEARESLHRTATWLVELYDALGKKGNADEWRKR